MRFAVLGNVKSEPTEHGQESEGKNDVADRVSMLRHDSRTGGEEILLPPLPPETIGGAFEIVEPEKNASRLRTFVRADDLHIFELLHDAHRTWMADRKLGLQRRGRRIIAF